MFKRLWSLIAGEPAANKVYAPDTSADGISEQEIDQFAAWLSELAEANDDYRNPPPPAAAGV